jgi:hypothetical protein
MGWRATPRETDSARALPGRRLRRSSRTYAPSTEETSVGSAALASSTACSGRSVRNRWGAPRSPRRSPPSGSFADARAPPRREHRARLGVHPSPHRARPGRSRACRVANPRTGARSVHRARVSSFERSSASRPSRRFVRRSHRSIRSHTRAATCSISACIGGVARRTSVSVREDLRVSRDEHAEFPTDAQHPLAHRDVSREDAVHHLRGQIDHSPLPAGGAEPAILAGESHREFVPTAGALHARCDGPTGPVTGGEMAPWPGSTAGTWSTTASYRDINQPGNGVTHAHFVEPLTTSPTGLASPAVRSTSPYAQN